MAMDNAHGTHAPHDISTPTSRPENARGRGHIRSRSRDASSDSHHHARDASLGGTARRVGGGGGGEEPGTNSRGSSPARPHAHSATPAHSTPPTLLRHAHNL
nr:uncharacterized protein LOC123762135 [Procambarus clarkii]